jgi:RNA polymerase-binding transcription factor
MADTRTRNADLKEMLSRRRRELQGDVQSRLRMGRAERTNEVRDDLERSDAASQGDIELTLTQMRAETLARVDEALARLAAGSYGFCFECAEEIAERRLRALPFAVRCQSCEECYERAGRARRFAPSHLGLPLFSNASGL